MLGAMDADQNLTSLGRVLLQLPVDAPIGKLCLYGSFFRCLDSALTLAAVLTNRDPFMAPLAAKQEAERIKDSWSPRSFRSDPLAIVAAYNAWKQIDDGGNYSRSTAFCQENFLSKQTLLQIKQVKQSLVQSLEQAGVIAVSAGGNFRPSRFRREVPEELNVNGNSLPLLAALISMASAPNFAIRTSEKICRTAQDKVSCCSHDTLAYADSRLSSSTPARSTRADENKADLKRLRPASTWLKSVCTRSVRNPVPSHLAPTHLPARHPFATSHDLTP